VGGNVARIAIVEDESSLRTDLVEYLEACGHPSHGCECGPALDDLLQKQPVDVVILDVNLPGESGFSIAVRLRERSAIGIIMLTARSLAVDRVVGLEVGADVYLTKPIDLRELEAQIRALERRLRVQGSGAPDGAAQGNLVPVPRPAPPPAPAVEPTLCDKIGRWFFDSLGWTLVSPQGASIRLTSNERIFLSLLVACPGEPVSRTRILEEVGGRQWDPTDRSVDSLVRRLRAKGAQVTGVPLPIEAVHGTGDAFIAEIETRNDTKPPAAPDKHEARGALEPRDKMT
jgi:two-component system, OmpR family, response regulator